MARKKNERRNTQRKAYEFMHPDAQFVELEESNRATKRRRRIHGPKERFKRKRIQDKEEEEFVNPSKRVKVHHGDAWRLVEWEPQFVDLEESNQATKKRRISPQWEVVELEVVVESEVKVLDRGISKLFRSRG